MSDEPSVADRFIAGSYGFTKHARLRRSIKGHIDIMERYRNDMRKANRFVLTNEFVEYCTIAATAPPRNLLSRLYYASLPYETTWIEFNMHQKIHTLQKIHKINSKSMKDIPRRSGVLLQRINSTAAVCTLMSEMDDSTEKLDQLPVMPHMTSYFFSTAPTDFAALSGIESGFQGGKKFFGCHMIPVGARIHGIEWYGDAKEWIKKARASLWGYTADNQFEDQLYSPRGFGTADDPITPTFLERHGEAGISRMFNIYYAVVLDTFGPKDAVREMQRMLTTEFIEFTGHMRWVVTMLAMLNEVPIHSEPVEPTGQIRVGLTQKRRFMDYHRVTLRLPKIKPMEFIHRRLTGSGRKHRAHEVRTHWRTYLHVPHCSSETHDWVYDHENGYRLCGKCMGFGRRIDEHIRGDPELGWVRKDYVVAKEHF